MTSTFKCVIDTNIVIKQFINDPLTEKANQLFEHLGDPSVQFYVPDLLYIESANVLCKYVRTQLYTAGQIASGLESLNELPLRVVSTKKLMTQAVEIGLKYNISAYESFQACFLQEGATF